MTRAVSASVTASVAFATSTRRWRLPEISSGTVPVKAQCGVSRATSKLTSGFGRCPAAWMPATSIARADRAARIVRLASIARAIASSSESVDGACPASRTARKATVAVMRAIVTVPAAGWTIRLIIFMD